jgi:hypothetical protein
MTYPVVSRVQGAADRSQCGPLCVVRLLRSINFVVRVERKATRRTETETGSGARLDFMGRGIIATARRKGRESCSTLRQVNPVLVENGHGREGECNLGCEIVALFFVVVSASALAGLRRLTRPTGTRTHRETETPHI